MEASRYAVLSSFWLLPHSHVQIFSLAQMILNCIVEMQIYMNFGMLSFHDSNKYGWGYTGVKLHIVYCVSIFHIQDVYRLLYDPIFIKFAIIKLMNIL